MTPPETKPLAPVFVLSGPSGAGKTTVVDEVLRQCRYPLRRVVTATTRPRRPNEVPGVDYHFWTTDEFRAQLEAGRMIEHAIVFGNDYYGTPKSEVEPHRQAGTGVLLIIDVQGAAQVRVAMPNDHVSIFLDVQSMEELEARLRQRGTEAEDKIARRLATAKWERVRAHEFQHRVLNDTVPRAVSEVLRIIEGEFQTRGVQPCSTN